MSIYQQSSLPNPSSPEGLGQKRRTRSGGSYPRGPRDLFLRRLGAMLLLGLLAAPVVWAMRGDNNGVDVPSTRGASALVQFDPSGDSVAVTVAPTTVAPTTVAPTTFAVSPQIVRVCASKYIVQAGDSWFGIAQKTGVKASLIAGTNNKTLQSKLLVGQEICLPPGAILKPSSVTIADVIQTTTPKPVCFGQYTVIAGDSWSGIAQKVGTRISFLTAANGKTTKSNLLIGQKICLPYGASVPKIVATTTVPVVPTTPTRTYSLSELQEIVRSAWPDNLEADAFFVVRRESNWHPTSHNSCCFGLFQLNWNAHKRWMANYGVTSAGDLFDPQINARIAYVAWQRSGSWGPWCTRNWCPST